MTPSEIFHLRKLRAQNLKQLRIDAKILKLDLSEASGLTRPTIDRIESGDKQWDIDSEIIYVNAITQLSNNKTNVDA